MRVERELWYDCMSVRRRRKVLLDSRRSAQLGTIVSWGNGSNRRLRVVAASMFRDHHDC